MKRKNHLFKQCLILALMLTVALTCIMCQKSEKVSVDDVEIKKGDKKLQLDLLKDQVNLSKVRYYVLPRPSVLAALLDENEFKYTSFDEINTKKDYTSPLKQALNLGSRAADGIYLLYADAESKATAAKINQVAEVVDALTVKLGLDQALANELENLRKAKDAGNYDQIRQDIDVIFGEIEQALSAADPDRTELAVLVSLGGFIEGLYIITDGLIDDFNEDVAKNILNQKEVVEAYKVSLEEKLPAQIKKDACISEIYSAINDVMLPGIEVLGNESSTTDAIKKTVKKMHLSAQILKNKIEQ